MLEAVDLYCERLGVGLWEEPFNAVTNLSFITAAWFSWLLAKRQEALTPGVWALLALMCAIGVGSALFHTYANSLTRLLDVLPILLFQLIFVWMYFRSVTRFGATSSSIIVLVYLLATLVGRQYPDLLNGSLIYAPALVLLFVGGLFHALTGRSERLVMAGAAVVFTCSLAFRSIDNRVCSDFPLGTHFLWHLLNGVVLYLLLRVLVANRPE